MIDKYRIKNWEKFQHYKDRNPPWIKLHYEIMTSSDWVMLADASKLLAVVCMMIASRNEGYVPNNLEYIKRVAYLDKLPNLKPLIECGFFEKPLADDSGSKQPQANARSETEAYSDIENIEKRHIYVDAYVKILAKPILKISDKRQRTINTFAKKFTLEEFEQGLEKVKQSDFLINGSFCKFDWIINETNFLKIMEGNYENRTGGQTARNLTGTNNQGYGNQTRPDNATIIANTRKKILADIDETIRLREQEGATTDFATGSIVCKPNN